MIRVRSDRKSAWPGDEQPAKRALIVVKFGGTSLGNPARIRFAARRIRQYSRKGYQPVVVASARGSTTDRLLRDIELVSRGNSDLHAQRETDRALATGENLSDALLASAINSLGISATSVGATDAILVAAGPHGAAQLRELRQGRLGSLIERSVVPVVAGFQGLRDDGELVTLGRGGSDVTAVFLAAQLGARACHIVTDVDGVYETDPRIAPSRKFHELTFDSLVELTQSGARVVHPAAAFAAREANVELHIFHFRASLTEPDGTIVGSVAEAVAC
jgi:aspartate kinase